MTGPASNPNMSLASPNSEQAQSASGSVGTAPTSPASWEKLIEVVEYLNDVVDPAVQVRFAIKRLAPGLPSEHRENVAIARKLGVSQNTVANWRSDAGTNCSCPLRVCVEVAKTFSGMTDGPEQMLRAFSRFTGEDHTCHFGWFGGADAV